MRWAPRVRSPQATVSESRDSLRPHHIDCRRPSALRTRTRHPAHNSPSCIPSRATSSLTKIVFGSMQWLGGRPPLVVCAAARAKSVSLRAINATFGCIGHICPLKFIRNIATLWHPLLRTISLRNSHVSFASSRVSNHGQSCQCSALCTLRTFQARMHLAHTPRRYAHADPPLVPQIRRRSHRWSLAHHRHRRRQNIICDSDGRHPRGHA